MGWTRWPPCWVRHWYKCRSCYSYFPYFRGARFSESSSTTNCSNTFRKPHSKCSIRWVTGLGFIGNLSAVGSRSWRVNTSSNGLPGSGYWSWSHEDFGANLRSINSRIRGIRHINENFAPNMNTENRKKGKLVWTQLIPYKRVKTNRRHGGSRATKCGNIRCIMMAMTSVLRSDQISEKSLHWNTKPKAGHRTFA